MRELWVEKYRPRTVSDYVFRDDKQKKQVSSGLIAVLFHTYCSPGRLARVRQHWQRCC